MHHPAVSLCHQAILNIINTFFKNKTKGSSLTYHYGKNNRWEKPIKVLMGLFLESFVDVFVIRFNLIPCFNLFCQTFCKITTFCDFIDFKGTRNRPNFRKSWFVLCIFQKIHVEKEPYATGQIKRLSFVTSLLENINKNGIVKSILLPSYM